MGSGDVLSAGPMRGRIELKPPHKDDEGGEHAGIIVVWPDVRFEASAVEVRIANNHAAIEFEGAEGSRFTLGVPLCPPLDAADWPSGRMEMEPPRTEPNGSQRAGMSVAWPNRAGEVRLIDVAVAKSVRGPKAIVGLTLGRTMDVLRADERRVVLTVPLKPEVEEP